MTDSSIATNGSPVAVEAAVASDGSREAPALGDPPLYFNREVSWLDFHDRVLQLAEHGIRLARIADLGPAERAELRERFERQIFPALTPLAVGPGRPFPYISNLSLSIAALVRDPSTDHVAFARVKVPREILPRFIPLSDGTTYVPLEELIAEHLGSLFPGMEVLEYDLFRVSRDADLAVADDAEDLAEAVENELRRRRFGELVRLDVGAEIERCLREQLVASLGIDDVQVYPTHGLLDLRDLWQLARLPGHADLRFPPFTAVTHPALPVH